MHDHWQAPDCDLSGDDIIKHVTYWITLAKPDYVVDLQRSRDETVDYHTDAASFAGLKIAQLMGRLTREGVEIPIAWTEVFKEEGYEVDTADGTARIKSIPDREQRYIVFNCRVNWQMAKKEANYERDTVSAIRKLSNKIS